MTSKEEKDDFSHEKDIQFPATSRPSFLYFSASITSTKILSFPDFSIPTKAFTNSKVRNLQ